MPKMREKVENARLIEKIVNFNSLKVYIYLIIVQILT
jgi:hypothetical protein